MKHLENSRKGSLLVSDGIQGVIFETKGRKNYIPVSNPNSYYGIEWIHKDNIFSNTKRMGDLEIINSLREEINFISEENIKLGNKICQL